ncbi:MAG TPA: RICIN domain-containing protein [Cytophagales bacterium]|nr:RICIN domain-containing protein [Cytophagales bacterium]
MISKNLLVWVLVGFTLPLAICQTQVKVDPNVRHQQMKGWGASLCWWANKAGGFSEAKVDEICRWIASPEELNMNVFRYNIGGGDNPSHNHLRSDGGAVPGFKASAGTPYNWDQDANQRKILLKLNALRNDAINEAFSNSPPHWMTKSGCVSGNTDGSDNLRDDQYAAFADYLTEVVKYYKENHNITFRILTPFNEPFSNWWKANGGQEGCRFNQGNQQKMILELYAKLSQKNMLSYCGISAMDANSIDEAVNGVNGYVSAGNIMSKLIQINAHSYSGSRRKELYDLGKVHNKEVWQSESGPLSVDLTGMDNYLLMAQRLITDLRDMKPVVWCDWQLMSDNDPRWGLIPANYANQAYRRDKSFYVRMQCTRFIKQGYTLIATNQPNTVAALSPGGTEVVMVVCNQGGVAQNMLLDLSLFQSVGTAAVYRTSGSENCAKIQGLPFHAKQQSYTAPSKSITTLVVPVTLQAPISGLFLLVARHSNKVLEVRSNAASADSIRQATQTNLPQQHWDISPEGPYYKIINVHTGMAMDVNGAGIQDGAAIIQYPYAGDDNQLWSLVDLGNGYFQILNKNSQKAVDITSASTAEGAKAIQYTGSTGLNQQFMLRPAVVTSTEHEVGQAATACFPNPFSDHLWVREGESFDYEIFDVNGTMLERSHCTRACLVGGKLEPGIYLLSIHHGKGHKHIKVVKQ